MTSAGHPPELSVGAVLPRLVAALAPGAAGRPAGGPAAVLVAPPGSGKTTLVPPALRAAGVGGGQRIVMLEPRRIAARAAARRIAELGGFSLGGEVGYQIRFERRASAATAILVVTEGILVQMLQADPFLAGVGVLIFDEFHERSLAADLSLAMARRVQREVRPDLVLLAMSATLDPGPLAAFLGGCPVLTAEGRQYPVEVTYLDDRQAPPPGERPSSALVAAGVRRALAATAGDVLAFLPGVGEILRTAEALADLAARQDLAVLPLYGDLPSARQDEVLRPGTRRKVVLATNVAETSITIEGVTAVVDSGLARRLRYDPSAGIDRLELARISRAAADQRAGRAGRLGPGLCLRLWTAREHAARPPHETPEIVRVDLAGPVLQLLAWGETDLAGFGWFEPPAADSLAAARRLLVRLGALSEDGLRAPPVAGAAAERGEAGQVGADREGGRAAGLTSSGRRMAGLPVHPRLARLLLEGSRLGVPRDAALLAALLAERDPFVRPPGRPAGQGTRGGSPATAVQASRSDLLDRLDALRRWEAADAREGRRRGGSGSGGSSDGGDSSSGSGRRGSSGDSSGGSGGAGADTGGTGPLNPAAARFVLRARDQLAELAARAGGMGSEAAPAALAPLVAPAAAQARDDALLRSLLAAYPDRLARRRAPHSPRAVMVGGRGVRLAEQSAVTAAELFLCVEVAPGPPGPQAEDLVLLASEVALEWLPAGRLRTAVEVELDTARERVAAWRRTRFEDLLLDEREVPPPDPEAAAALLAEAAAARLETALPLDDPEVAAFLVRARCLADWMPELALPRFDAAAISALLPELARGRRSFAELRRAPLLARLRGTLSQLQLAALEREAPERLLVPSGSRIRLSYEEGKPPVLAARIQELFGLAETPRIAAGRVPVLLHLLAPNLRPQQVTGDLRSFWRNTYPQVRKELQGRYPRHAWPEDPWSAPPERRPAPRGPRAPRRPA
ncbi:MAG TPA: ATP-dependent helicase C-terminal domain-containing protein [Thermoanaerobaculia bacterium]|nr:ATP-dependent helicase C-terminal domain-containing protein [Thermoanaerobaculia bacterium]